jgi:SAM-dependent methyltransferase
MNLIARIARRLNWARRSWSPASDQAFHDALFADRTHDIWSDAYPGRVTIRRFADLAAAHVEPSAFVLDLGCGPGEITCELALRFPASRVVGIDHSGTAIERARKTAGERGLANVTFETADVETYEPSGTVGLVTMFDAFHHLLDPQGFVERLGRHTDRFLLLEPAGNWLGQWQKSIDLDWLAEALFVIRDRLEYQFALEPTSGARSQAPAAAGEPVEQRYLLDDYYEWFAGFGVEVTGTVAGLERYGTRPEAESRLRADVGRLVYDVVGEIDAILRRHDLDLGAKHWAIYAERGRQVERRTVPEPRARETAQPLAGPYDVTYASFGGPTRIRAGDLATATVRVLNKSWRTWDSGASPSPVFVSYHWLDAQGRTLAEDGLRSPLPRPLEPGASCDVALRVQAPSVSGRCILAIDLVHEGVSWFSAGGAPALRVPVDVIS